MMDVKKCVIIGSGPAGYTAAIYAARANLSPSVYTGQEPGGQLMQTTHVDNFPGYPKGILGPELMTDLQSQAERFGTQVFFEKIASVNFQGPVHQLTTESGEMIHTHSVIIATGASAKWLNIPGEERLKNNGVSACAVCDGFFFRNMEVAIVGGGDTAAEEASYLAKLCSKVHLLVRKDTMRASKIMQDRLKQIENLQIHWNTETLEILGDQTIESIRIRNNKTQEETLMPLQGFFVAIGHQPNTDIFAQWLDRDETGYLITTPGRTHTKVPGVFVSGDAADRIYRQAVTAAGTGCMAALDAEAYLSHQGLN